MDRRRPAQLLGGKTIVEMNEWWPDLPVGLNITLSKHEAELIQLEIQGKSWALIAKSWNSICGLSFSPPAVKEHATVLHKQLRAQKLHYNASSGGKNIDDTSASSPQKTQPPQTRHLRLISPETSHLGDNLAFMVVDPANLQNVAVVNNTVNHVVEDPRAKGVEEVVYALSQPLPALGPVTGFNLSRDRERFKMVVKWMVFYRYIPGNTAELEPKRTELRKRLGFSSAEYGARLGWFLNRQFRTFKEKGVLSQSRDRQPAAYLPEAERWLSKDWDGNIRFERDGQQSRPSSSGSTKDLSLSTPQSTPQSTLKRPAPNDLSNEGKRHKAPLKNASAATRLADIPILPGMNNRIRRVLESESDTESTAAAGETDAANRAQTGSTSSSSLSSPTTPDPLDPPLGQLSSPIREADQPPTNHLNLRESTTLVTRSSQALQVRDRDPTPQLATSAPAGKLFTPPKLPYSHSPYSTQVEPRPIVPGLQGVAPPPEQENAVGQPVQEKPSNHAVANISLPSLAPQAVHQDVYPMQSPGPSDLEQQIRFSETTLLKDSWIIHLFREGVNRGEFRQYDKLVSLYEFGWLDCYLSHSRSSPALESTLNQAKQELSLSDSPLKSLQDFEKLLSRWRGERAKLLAAAASKRPILTETVGAKRPASVEAAAPKRPVSAEAELTMQPQHNPHIPSLQSRREYEEWCQKLDDCKVAIPAFQKSREVLEDGISRMKETIIKVEGLEEYSRLPVTEDEQRDTLLRVRDSLASNGHRELQVLESEMQTLLEASLQKEVEIKDLEEKKRLYVSRVKSGLQELEAIVEFVRSLPEL